MSPTQYIKARRLNEARRDLVASDPSTHTVAQIALGNGMPHLGRFSVNYRAQFGESPRETLAASSASGQLRARMHAPPAFLPVGGLCRDRPESVHVRNLAASAAVQFPVPRLSRSG